MTIHWHPGSWQKKICLQPIHYPVPSELEQALIELQRLPPLVTHQEVDLLKTQLAEACYGQRFLLQGGDCAERFADCSAEIITNKLKILLQMSLILVHGLRKPVVRVGRIAGQYAKPRSVEIETIDGLTLPPYRGDLINKPEFTELARLPNPQFLIQGYHCAAQTLNYIRALLQGGFANLQHPENWNLDFVQHSSLREEYQAIAASVRDWLKQLKADEGLSLKTLRYTDFYTSHEALNLYYEQALTRQIDHNKWYNLATHFPWVGMRTADIEGAHIEYLSGINNPVAVKIGPDVAVQDVVELVNILNPYNEPGRLTLMHRFGVSQIEAQLPRIIEAVKNTGKIVLWSCDPMHGNTQLTEDGIKTRRFNEILEELAAAFRIHHAMGSHLGGVHFELSGEDVTECIGGARGLAIEDLKRAYKSLIDPRLNYEQALEMAMLIVKHQ